MTAGDGRAVYVYGVVAAGAALPAAPSGAGPLDAPVRAIEGDGFAAVVSDVPGDWEAATRADVEAHEGVLSALVAERTVVPMRFGVVMPSDDEVRTALLARHAERLRELLAHLEGRVQMSVKAYYGEDTLLRAVLRAHPELKRRSDALAGQPPERTQAERVELGREVAHAVEQQRAIDEQALAEPLAAVADEVRLDPPASERMALNAHLLVARERRAALDAAVQKLSAAHGDRVAIRYIGPLAPYSFSDLSLEAAGA